MQANEHDSCQPNDAHGSHPESSPKRGQHGRAHSHRHGHTHGHHAHLGDDAFKLNRSFAWATVLNLILVFGEATGGLLAGSMSLLADAGHNLSDVGGLVLAWWAHWLRGRRRGGRWTYGWRAFTILAANINGLLLVVAIVGVGLESLRRLFTPADVAEIPVVIVALIATVINFATAKLLSGGSQHDLNVRGAYLHMLADAAVSLAVVLGALTIIGTGWQWIDPAISLGICVVLAISTWGLLKESTTMLMQAAPRQVDLQEIRQSLESDEEVAAVEDLHVWSASTTETLMTARIRCPQLENTAHDRLLARLHARLKHDFDVSHATLEITHQVTPNTVCSLDDV